MAYLLKIIRGLPKNGANTMSDIPDKIETSYQSNEGFEYERTEREIMKDIIVAINDLIDCVHELQKGNQ